MNFSPDDNLLLSVVCLEPKPNELEHINDLLPQVQDWEQVVSLLTQHGSAPLLYSIIINHKLIDVYQL